MERKIHVLPHELTLKIAAGEVIERPASILKELLENALDAGATALRVELRKGGCAGIRIEDNGSGIPHEEAPLAFERFATSKIADFDDLYGVTSYGFRGEALPSIAAIARIEMTTRTKAALSGTRIIAEAGRVQEISEIGCPVGTSILVTCIFDNVPVRKKFLKAEATEQGYCLDVMHCAALADEKVKIDVFANNRSLLSIPSTSRMDDRIAMILGREAGDHLVPVAGRTEEGLHLRGYVSRPGWNRSSAKHLYCFVNGRHVKDQLINHAVMTAYRNVLEAKRYPVAVLHLDVPPGAVDVNVHPAKREVRFQDPRGVYGLIVESVLHVLADLSPEQTVPPAESPAIRTGGYQARVEDALKRYHLHTGGAKLSFRLPPPLSPPAPQAAFTLAEESSASHFFPEAPAARVSFGDLDYLGQSAGTYLVFAGPDGLILIDQHASHERILFERLRSAENHEPIIRQELLIPDVMPLTPRDYEVITDYLPFFPELGMDVEPFGDNTVVIKAVPAMMPDLDARGLIQDIIDDTTPIGETRQFQNRKDRLLAAMACRGAVKANQDLSPSEAAALCRDLDKTDFAATCPHGRPTYVPISKKELERLFKRK